MHACMRVAVLSTLEEESLAGRLARGQGIKGLVSLEGGRRSKRMGSEEWAAKIGLAIRLYSSV